MKKYSFVIPSYQCKTMTRNTLLALNRLKGFRREEYEVIIVDDGSTDGTQKHIGEMDYDFDLKYIYLERNDQSCRSRARNFGWRAAEGEVVIFIDADILVKNDFLLELERFYSKNKDLYVIGTRIMLPGEIEESSIIDGSIFELFQFNPKFEELLEFRYAIFNELSYNTAKMKYPFLYALSCNIALPKKILEKIGGFDETMKKWGVEDIEMAYRAHSTGLKIVLNSRLEVLHQFHVVYGDFVNEDKVDGVRENAGIFLKKHKDAFGISEDEVYELFMSIATRFRYLENPSPNIPKARSIINFVNKRDLSKVKKMIVNLCSKDEFDIVVKDFVENTDLDLWIQTLDRCINPPYYYPMSKQLKPNYTEKNHVS